MRTPSPRVRRVRDRARRCAGRRCGSPSDAHAGAFGVGRGAPVAAAEPDRSGQLLGEGVDLELGACGALAVVPALGLVELVLEVSEPPPVGGLRLHVEQHAGVVVRVAADVERGVGGGLLARGPVRRPGELEGAAAPPAAARGGAGLCWRAGERPRRLARSPTPRPRAAARRWRRRPCVPCRCTPAGVGRASRAGRIPSSWAVVSAGSSSSTPARDRRGRRGPDGDLRTRPGCG